MTSIGGGTRVTISPSVYCRAFGHEVVLLEFARGEYFGLDEIGAEIWRGLEAGSDLSTIAAKITTLFDVGKEAALSDIVALVTELRDHGLVELSLSQSAP